MIERRERASTQDALILEIVGDLLAGLRHSRQTVAKKTGRSPQTADRWIRRIAATVPGARTVREGKTTWLICAKRQALPTERAAIGACVSASLASIFAGSQHERNLRDARDYLLRCRDLAYEDLDRKFYFAARGGDACLPDHSTELDKAIEGLLNSRLLEFSYIHNSGKTETLVAKPLCLAIFDHQFYLIAGHGESPPYAFRLSRISAVHVCGATFSYPSKLEFDPNVLFGPLFGIHLSTTSPVQDIEVILSGAWASYAKGHKWHASQHNTPLQEGRVLVRLRVRLCPELETWVLGFGEYCEVQRPLALKKKIRQRVEANYQALFGSTSRSRGDGPVKARARQTEVTTGRGRSQRTSAGRQKK